MRATRSSAAGTSWGTCSAAAAWPRSAGASTPGSAGPVAIKQLRADLATDPTFQARFRREAQSAAGLNHPTIVSVYDTGEETDPRTGISIPYIVMELVDGKTLRDVLREGRKILPERALELTQGCLTP